MYKDIFDYEKLMSEFKKKINEEEEKMTFEDAYDMCDFEIQCRYDYLDELLCEIEDEIYYLIQELERTKINEEVAEEMLNLGFDVRNEYIKANDKRVQLQKKIEYLEEKYEIIYDLYDEVFLGILANIE